jgi:hypothetical protein
MHFMVHSTKQKQGNRALNQSSHNFISLTTSLKEYSQTSKHSLLSGVQSDHRTLLGGVQSDHVNQGIREEGREDQDLTLLSGGRGAEGAAAVGGKAGDGGGGPVEQEGRHTRESTGDGTTVSFNGGGTRTGSASNPRRLKMNPRHEVIGLSSPPQAYQAANLFPATSLARIADNFLSPALHPSPPKKCFRCRLRASLSATLMYAPCRPA